MENVETPEPTSQTLTAGQTLLKAREEAGLSRADIASRTKVAERHILSIEEDRFEDLAARTYAVGFSRAYARALGLDEKVIAEKVRAQLDAHEPYAPVSQPSFEPGDPARVPSSGLAWLAGGAVVLVIGLVFYFWSSVFSPEGELPSLMPDDEPSAAPAPAQAIAAASPSATVPSGPVVLTAKADQVWLRVSDGSGATLVETVLARGESWTVPADTKAPKLRTARPDALAITVGGTAVPVLSDKPETVSGVSLAPRDLLGSSAPAPASNPAVTPAPTSAPTAASARSPRAMSTPTVRTSPAASPRPTPSRTATARPSPVPSRTATARSATASPTPSAPATQESGGPVSILPTGNASPSSAAGATAVSTTSE
ncbi:helix-turn-helix domain-containing protein [Novosphingobium sp. BW1]|uniref:helix-turn-helix domain-containing protein n=1 Tax=Novosphingobium sp. BW1 TaxID=2592621 RepID=UPI0019684316|nr:helix-turn-helix domain-containing protein [Novosphingobium sp. BW1]